MKGPEPINKNHINRMYVERNTSVSRISTVDRVSPVKPVFNNVSHVNENFLLYVGIFYDNFSQLREQYQKFYLYHQKLEHFLQKEQPEQEHSQDQEQEGTQQEPPDQTLQPLIESLVKTYNEVLQSLKTLELHYQALHHSATIQEIFEPYLPHLEKIGLTLDTAGQLSFDPEIFLQNLEKNQDCLHLLFDYKTGLVKALFNHFRNIKVSAARMLPTYNEEGTLPSAGMIVDKKF